MYILYIIIYIIIYIILYHYCYCYYDTYMKDLEHKAFLRSCLLCWKSWRTCEGVQRLTKHSQGARREDRETFQVVIDMITIIVEI